MPETDDEKYLTARVTAAEYRKVKENAEAAGMALNAYIKSAALNSQIIVFNYDAVLEHIRQINEIKKVLYPFIAAALQSQKVFETDIYKVISLMQSIETSEKRLIKAVKNERDRFNRKYQ